jgi:hypothetical protein
MEVMDKAMINMDTQHKLHMMLEHMDMEATQGMGIILTRSVQTYVLYFVLQDLNS